MKSERLIYFISGMTGIKSLDLRTNQKIKTLWAKMTRLQDISLIDESMDGPLWKNIQTIHYIIMMLSLILDIIFIAIFNLEVIAFLTIV